MARSAYGKKDGTSANAGKSAYRYQITLPDGSIVTKRSFGNWALPTGYAYQHEGKWFLAGVSAADDPKFGANYTQCPALDVTVYEAA